MPKPKHDEHAGNGADQANPDQAAETQHNEQLATVATVAVVGVGVLVFEAALLPGLVLGVAAMLAPKYLPRMGHALSPMLRSTVRGAYKVGQKAREVAAEAQEQMSDILAEVEVEAKAKAKAETSPKPAAIRAAESAA